MPNFLICPYCGKCQYNTKTIRQIGVAAKNIGKVAGSVLVKQGAKSVAQSVGVSNDITLRSIGRGGGKLAEEMGLGYKNTQSLSSVQYKCSRCGQYWDGYDSTSTMNDIQKSSAISVIVKCQKHCEEIYKKYVKSIIRIICLFGVCIYLWISRSSREVQNSIMWIDYTSTEYSWHYYVFWPLFVITSIMFMIVAPKFLEHHRNKSLLANMDVTTFYKHLLNSDSCVIQYL